MMNARLALLACILLFACSPRLAAQEAGKEPWKYHEPFQGPPKTAKDFQLLGYEAAQRVKYENEGVRITLPAGKTHPPTGVATTFGIKGDFDVSVRYEIFQEPDPADSGLSNTGTRISLTLKLDERSEAAMRRKITPEQPVHILAWRTIRPAGETKQLQKGVNFPVMQKSGRLRMQRNGTELSYHLAEGDDKEFKMLTTFSFVADDIQMIQLFGHTTDAKAALDARFTDLNIVSSAPVFKLPAPPVVRPVESPKAPNPVPDAAVKPAAAPPPVPTSSGPPLTLLLALGGVLVILTIIVVGILIVLMMRSRNGE
jgi:hypothetical protein